MFVPSCASLFTALAVAGGKWVAWAATAVSATNKIDKIFFIVHSFNDTLDRHSSDSMINFQSLFYNKLSLLLIVNVIFIL